MIERMKAVRQDHDETQKELSIAIRYNRIQIAKYENGTNTPGISYIEAFCRHYEVSADYILGLPKGLSWPR